MSIGNTVVKQSLMLSVSRKGAVQTRNQVLCIEEFSQYLRPLRIVFSDVWVQMEFPVLKYYLNF